MVECQDLVITDKLVRSIWFRFSCQYVSTSLLEHVGFVYVFMCIFLCKAGGGTQSLVRAVSHGAPLTQVPVSPRTALLVLSAVNIAPS